MFKQVYISMDQTENKGMMSRLEDAHEKHREKMYEDLPWKAWGSWFSWGSPVGLSIFFCSLLISIGVFLLLLHKAGILR